MNAGTATVGLPGQLQSVWDKIPNVQFVWKKIRYPVYRRVFPANTQLSAALNWILDNSIFQENRLFKPKFIEVSLVWHLQRKLFIAYTAQANNVTTYNRTLGPANLVFVAHVHPTKQERGSGAGVTERTDSASQKDLEALNTDFKHHRYSIIVHRDKDNKTPCGFIFDFKLRGKQVMSRTGTSVFQQLATEYMKLNSNVGRY